MATLNILSPSPMTNSLFNITNYSRAYHNIYYNNINVKCKHLLFPNYTHCSVVSSLFSQSKSNPSLKSSPMQTHFSKSGIFIIFYSSFRFYYAQRVSYMVLVVEFYLFKLLNLLWLLFLGLQCFIFDISRDKIFLQERHICISKYLEQYIKISFYLIKNTNRFFMKNCLYNIGFNNNLSLC